jgi:maltose O-acetyltransferase
MELTPRNDVMSRESFVSAPVVFLDRVLRALVMETSELRVRVSAARLVSSLVPPDVGGRLRASLLRHAGFAVGSGTVVHGTPRINGIGALSVGDDCEIGVECTFDLSEPITIGDRVTLGYQVMVLTSTHELGPGERRAGEWKAMPVSIESGAWIGARSILLPGVTVGRGAVVAPGSLVNKEVPPHTRAAGAPAKIVETLTP